jgi:predicted transposase YdaD
MGLYGERHSERDVQGLGIFMRKGDAPDFPRRIAGADSPVQAVYLEGFLPEWLAREPDNPYVAVLAPLAVASDAELRERAPALWQSVRQAPLPQGQRDRLSDVMLFWFLERFRSLTRDEVWSMLNLLTAIEETSGYQAIKAEGKIEGKAEGKTEGKAEGMVEAKADNLTRLLTRRFGALPAWAAARIAEAELARLDAWLDGIFDADSLTDLLGPEQAPPH